MLPIWKAAKPAIGEAWQKEAMMSSRFIVQNPGGYLLWAAATGHQVGILVNGADVGFNCRSDMGPFSDPHVAGERELCGGDEVTTVPGMPA